MIMRMNTKFIYIVGLPIWASYHGDFMNESLQVFWTYKKAKAYVDKFNVGHKIIKRFMKHEAPYDDEDGDDD